MNKQSIMKKQRYVTFNIFRDVTYIEKIDAFYKNQLWWTNYELKLIKINVIMYLNSLNIPNCSSYKLHDIDKYMSN